jgi:predicted phage gp36 major capsid-like protein
MYTSASARRTFSASVVGLPQGRRHAVPLIFGPGGSGNPKRNFGDWCAKVATACIGRSAEALAAAAALEKEYGSVPGDGFRTKASLAESSGITGGYTVPPDFYQQLLRIVAENTFIRPRAFVQPMASATLQFPFLDVTTVQSACVSPFFGGVQMYWTEEAQTRTETEPQFKMMELKAHELSGYSVSSNVLLADAAFGLEKFLMTLFGQAIAWFEEYAFLQGNGVGKPQGMLGAACSATVNRNAGNQVQRRGDKYLTVRVRCYQPTDLYALSVKTESQKFRREISAQTAAALLTGSDLAKLDLLPASLVARLMALANGDPIVPVVTVQARRYAVEDQTDRLTLDLAIKTDSGKCLETGVLEFKSTVAGAEPPDGLIKLCLRPVKISKFLWATLWR